MIAQETGKLLAIGIGEVERAGQFFRCFAASALRQYGDIHPGMVPNSTVTVTREPVAIPAWKIAPALSYGNAVIFKPSELAALTGYELSKIIDRSDLPRGVFNMVFGAGPAGQTITAYEHVNAVSFTGSRDTGQKTVTSCAARGDRVQLGMGGKNPQLVLKDVDVEEAVIAAVNGAFGSTGQRRTASSRIIFEEAVFEDFKTRFLDRTGSLVVGDALSTETLVGPVISHEQLQKNLGYVELGVSEGAALLTPDYDLNIPASGHFMHPVAFVSSDNDLGINQEEVFDRVACLIPARNYEHGLKLANATIYGLASGIFTSSQKYAEDFKRNSRAGVVRVNMMTPGSDCHVRFGGTRRSSFGSREQGEYAAKFFTNVKTSYTRYFRPSP